MKKPKTRPKSRPKPAYTFSFDIPKPKTQTLWAVVCDLTGFVYEASSSDSAAMEVKRRCDGLCVSIRRLTVPAFAPKPKRKERKQ